VIKYNQIILVLNNLIGKTYITSYGIHLALSLAKKYAGDVALFHRMIGDIY
jgi:hypothetical protein